MASINIPMEASVPATAQPILDGFARLLCVVPSGEIGARPHWSAPSRLFGRDG